MNKICKRIFFAMYAALHLFMAASHAQVKFGENKTTINAGSLLELESSASPYKGVLFPRINLSSSTTWTLNGSGIAAMMVYNTNAAITSSNSSYPILPGGIGMYYWDGTGWLGMTYPTGISNAQYWALKGNSGTSSNINFLGTTDNHPLVFKVNGQLGGYIDSSAGKSNTFLGYQAGQNISSGGLNVFLGHNAATAATTASGNVVVGTSAGFQNQTGNNNTFVGYSSGFATTSAGNNFVGYYSGYSNSTGSQNNFNGFKSGYTNTTGSNNHFDGFQAGYANTTGSNNFAVGYGADMATSALTKAGAIGYNAKVSASNSLVLGGTVADAVNVGIGTTAPVELFQVGDGSTGPNNPVILLQSNGNASGLGGILRFREQSYPTSNYGMDIRHSTGSAGVTNEGLYFERVSAGTTTAAVFIDQGNGRLGIGNSNPQQVLHVSGTTTVGNIGTTGTHTNTPLVRIDGLSSTNNTVHLTGDAEPRPVYATRNGDLIIAPSDSVLVSIDDFLTTTVPVTVPANGGVNSISSTILPNTTPVFTLARRAVVQISYSITALFQLNSTSSVTDGIVRASICKFDVFNTGTSATVKAGIGTSSSYYTNTNAAGNTATVLGGYAYNNGTYNIELAAGSYSLIFTLTGATGSGVSAYISFGGGIDMLQVVAHYK